MPVKDNPLWENLTGGARYYRRLGIELAVIYGVSMAAGIDSAQAAAIAGHYGILRNGIDGIDALIWKQGRMYDHLIRHSASPATIPAPQHMAGGDDPGNNGNPEDTSVY